MRAFSPRGKIGLLLGLLLAASAQVPAAHADKIANKMAVFAFLDKVTARISKKAVPINQTVQFGTLRVTARACFTRPLTEEPKTTSFVEVQDQKLDGHFEQLFSGWMLAQSPGLHAVEHPVYDVWLTDCDSPGKVAAVAAPAQPAAAKPAKKAKPAAAAEPDATAADVFQGADPAADPAADPSLDPAAAEAQPGDATTVPDQLPLKKRRVKRQ
jgi:hypothetical protein